MKVFITGGTGLIGKYLVPNLIENGHEVFVLTRNVKNAHKQLGKQINFIIGNPTEQGSWVDELSGIDAVINLVGANILKKRWSKKRKNELYNSRILSKNNLINALSMHISNNPNKIRVIKI